MQVIGKLLKWQGFIYFTSYTGGGNRNAESYTWDCQTFSVINHISIKRASYELSCCLQIALGGKKVAAWIFLSLEGLPPEEYLLSGFLQDDRGRMSGHIPLLTQWGSLSSFKNRFGVHCLKHIWSQIISITLKNFIQQCQSIH